jgi:hypothetical protein
MFADHAENWALGVVLWALLLGSVLTAGGQYTVRVLRRAPRFRRTTNDDQLREDVGRFSHEWHDRFDRDRRSFDRMWRWVVPLALVLAVVGALATLSLYAGLAAWLWSHAS